MHLRMPICIENTCNFKGPLLRYRAHIHLEHNNNFVVKPKVKLFDSWEVCERWVEHELKEGESIRYKKARMSKLSRRYDCDRSTKTRICPSQVVSKLI